MTSTPRQDSSVTPTPRASRASTASSRGLKSSAPGSGRTPGPRRTTAGPGRGPGRSRSPGRRPGPAPAGPGCPRSRPVPARPAGPPGCRAGTPPRRAPARPAAPAPPPTTHSFVLLLQQAGRDRRAGLGDELVDQHPPLAALDPDDHGVGGHRDQGGGQRPAGRRAGVVGLDGEGHDPELAPHRPAGAVAPQGGGQQPAVAEHLPGEPVDVAQPARVEVEPDQALGAHQLGRGGGDGGRDQAEGHLLGGQGVDEGQPQDHQGHVPGDPESHSPGHGRSCSAAQAKHTGTGQSGWWGSASMPRNRAAAPAGGPASRRRTATISRRARAASTSSIRARVPAASSPATVLEGTRDTPRPRSTIFLAASMLSNSSTLPGSTPA